MKKRYVIYVTTEYKHIYAFIYYTKTENVYENLQQLFEYFDNSEYPENNE